MVNGRGQGLSITPFDPQGATDRALAPGIYAPGQSAETASAVSLALSARVGALADQLAGNEGKKAGLVDGQSPDYRPSDGWTIRAQAHDKAATDVYLSNLTAKFHSDALDVYEAHKADPAGFRSAYDGLVAGYQKDHVFPEIGGAFTENATRLSTTLRRSVLDRFNAKQKDENHAALIGNMASRETASQRLLAIDPHDPATEQSIMRLRDEDVADIRSQVASGAITAVQGEKLILDRQQSAQTDLVTARARTLGNADDIDAYRARLKKDFSDGKLPGLTDWNGLDASLGKLSHQKRTEADGAMKVLNSDLDGFLERQQQGLAGTADWAAIEAKGKALGPAGIAAVQAARDKLAIRKRIAALGPDEADRYVLDLEKGVKAPLPTAVTADGNGDKWASVPDVQRTVATAVRASGLVGTVPPDGARHGIKTGSEAEWTAFMMKAAQAESAFSGDRVRVNEKFTETNGVISEGLFSASKSDLGNYPEVAAAIGLAGQKSFTQEQMDNPDLQARFAAGVFAQNIRSRGTIREGVGATQGPIARGEVDFSGPVPVVPGGMSSAASDVIGDARKFAEERRKLVGSDPLLAALRDGYTSDIAPVDFAASGTDLAAAFRARVAQADAVATTYRRPPAYIRPDEKPLLLARLDKGGDEALSTVMGLVEGAGSRAPAVLKEIGDGAPALAHAAQVALSTGDRSFARDVAEAQAARAVPGSKPPTPKETDVGTAMRKVLGPSLQGLDAADEARTRSAVIAWTERQMTRRNIAFGEASKMQSLLEEAVQRARGATGTGDAAFGGVAPVRYGPPGWGREHASAIAVQVPASVKASRFGDVLAAVTDDDLKGLADPPVDVQGRTLSAFDLRRNAPVFRPGGYSFATIDATTGTQSPIAAKSGRLFVLPWAELAPTLRSRVPDAFR